MHPQEGDVICFQPDLNLIDTETMYQLMKVYLNTDIFGESKLAFIPVNIKQFKNKEEAQIYIDKLQNIVDQMKE